MKPAVYARVRSRRARLALAVVACALSPVPASALAGEPGLIVSPHPAGQTGLSYFRLTVRNGRPAQAGTIELRNPSSKPMRVVLAAVDGQTLGTLGSSYAPGGTKAHDSTRWLRLGGRKVSIGPHASIVVRVSVAAPKKAKPGDYLAGVSIEQLGQGAKTSAKHGIAIASVVRYAIGVEMTVPGRRRPSIVFTGATVQRQPAGPVFLLLARNRGNVILTNVHGTAVVTSGHRLGPGTFVSHTSIEYPLPAYHERPSEGARYRVRALLRYEGGVARLDTNVAFGRAQAVTQRTYERPAAGHRGTAWWKIAGVALLVAYAFGASLLLLRRRRVAGGGASTA
jgi:hypothetical protein